MAVANSAQYEELYGYDAMQRLKTMDRGTLNAGKTGLTTRSFDQCWTLDPTGNWNGFRQDDTGDGAWDLIQARTSNPVNEITNIANSVGSAWANPAYDAAGNMTTIPKPANPTQSFAATYDAWNRLVKLSDGANTVAEYQYDARNYRTVQKSYTGGVMSETRHTYYTNGWQDIEERLGTSPDSTNPDRQFVWGLRYIDDLVLRDRDTDGNGSLDERHYALQDANWNVIALTNTSGDVQERYAYQAYGTPKFLTPAFGNRASSSYGWETMYCGYRFESATVLFHIRNRVYHAGFGTWIQRDPLDFLAGDVNLYRYLSNLPLQKTDPSGLIEPVTCILIIGGLIVISACGCSRRPNPPGPPAPPVPPMPPECQKHIPKADANDPNVKKAADKLASCIAAAGKGNLRELANCIKNLPKEIGCDTASKILACVLVPGDPCNTFPKKCHDCCDYKVYQRIAKDMCTGNFPSAIKLKVDIEGCYTTECGGLRK